MATDMTDGAGAHRRTRETPSSQAAVRHAEEPVPLREAKKLRTRSQLLEAALALIGRQGFEGTTINEIAAAIQVSPRTLLRYFPTKEDVIVSWFEDGMSILRDGVKTRLAGESDREALLAAARQMLTAYEARADFYLVIERIVAASPQVFARRQQMIERLTRDVSATLAARGGAGASDPLVCDVRTGTVFAMIRAAVRAWVATNGSESLMDLFAEAVATVEFVDPKSSLSSGPLRIPASRRRR
jgi:AcrR family transcriptional regulator